MLLGIILGIVLWYVHNDHDFCAHCGLFVCLLFELFFIPLKIFFSLIRRPQHYCQTATNFDLYSALMAIEK